MAVEIGVTPLQPHFEQYYGVSKFCNYPALTITFTVLILNYYKMPVCLSLLLHHSKGVVQWTVDMHIGVNALWSGKHFQVLCILAGHNFCIRG